MRASDNNQERWKPRGVGNKKRESGLQGFLRGAKVADEWMSGSQNHCLRADLREGGGW